jgi:hypothetical protein
MVLGPTAGGSGPRCRFVSCLLRQFPREATGLEPTVAVEPVAKSAQHASDRYSDVDARIAELTESIDPSVKFAAAQAIQVGAQASIRAINTATRSSDGLGQLVSTMD